MGYMKIQNLYKSQDILMLNEVFAMEKIHGTSVHIHHKDGKLRFFSGGATHELFVSLFDQDELIKRFEGVNATVYGEGYGGKLLKMSKTYGEKLKFVAFDVLINDCWLDVPSAERFVHKLGLEFVDYVQCSTNIDVLNRERDKPSTQAIRNGMGNDKQREGVVLRPLVELQRNNGGRMIVKHKAEGFCETKTPREVTPEELQVLRDAEGIAIEWVTPNRLEHVLDKLSGEATMENMREIIGRMQQDIKIEGEGEIVWGRATAIAIARQTAAEMKRYLQKELENA